MKSALPGPYKKTRAGLLSEMEVDKRHVDRMRRQSVQSILDSSAVSRNFQIRFRFEQTHQAFANNGVVVQQQNAYFSSFAGHAAPVFICAKPLDCATRTAKQQPLSHGS